MSSKSLMFSTTAWYTNDNLDIKVNVMFVELESRILMLSCRADGGSRSSKALVVPRTWHKCVARLYLNYRQLEGPKPRLRFPKFAGSHSLNTMSLETKILLKGFP